MSSIFIEMQEYRTLRQKYHLLDVLECKHIDSMSRLFQIWTIFIVFIRS